MSEQELLPAARAIFDAMACPHGEYEIIAINDEIFMGRRPIGDDVGRVPTMIIGPFPSADVAELMLVGFKIVARERLDGDKPATQTDEPEIMLAKALKRATKSDTAKRSTRT